MIEKKHEYVIRFTEEVWYEAVVEAESEEAARELFDSEDFDWSIAKVKRSEMHDSISIQRKPE